VAAILSAVLLAGLLTLGILERRARDRALAAIPVRIHVNGTRGKSSVTRLIAGGLREAGIRTVAKTTGTAPRLILPDGTERPVRRRAPASVREQLWALREAHRLGATAVVIECMAVDPDLQALSEEQMIRSTIGVITNARLDHGEVMGSSVGDVAAALASTVPRAGVLVIGPTAGEDALERAARSKGTRVVHAGHPDGGASRPQAATWAEINALIALAVTREIGIADEVARRGMEAAAPDPGALQSDVVEVAGRRIAVLDASAANDPESLRVVLGPRGGGALFVFQHRADRPARLGVFGDEAPWSHEADAVVVTGDRPDWLTWRRLRRRLAGERLAFSAPARLADELRRRLAPAASPALVVFCGNTKGLRAASVVAALRQV
jgi:gamma-polyglutamate synthase